MTPGTPRPVGIQIPSPDFQVPVPHCFSCLVAVVLLPVPPPIRKALHPGKPLSLLLIFRPVENRQVDHLTIQGQGKAEKFFLLEKIFIICS